MSPDTNFPTLPLAGKISHGQHRNKPAMLCSHPILFTKTNSGLEIAFRAGWYFADLVLEPQGNLSSASIMLHITYPTGFILFSSPRWKFLEDKDWWERKLVPPLWKIVRRFLKKLRLKLPYDPAIPLLSIYPKYAKTLTQRDIFVPMLIRALFTITKVQKHLSAHQKMNDSIYMCIMEYYSVIKKVKSCHLQQHGRTLSEGIN